MGDVFEEGEGEVAFRQFLVLEQPFDVFVFDATHICGASHHIPELTFRNQSAKALISTDPLPAVSRWPHRHCTHLNFWLSGMTPKSLSAYKSVQSKEALVSRVNCHSKPVEYGQQAYRKQESS